MMTPKEIATTALRPDWAGLPNVMAKPLAQAYQEAVEGIKRAIERCSCSPRERDCGHLVECYVPDLEDILSRHGWIHIRNAGASVKTKDL